VLDLRRYGVKIHRVPDEKNPETGSYSMRYYDATDAIDAKNRAMRKFGREYHVSEVWLYSNECFGTDS
jgi:hypothetical protein